MKRKKSFCICSIILLITMLFSTVTVSATTYKNCQKHGRVAYTISADSNNYYYKTSTKKTYATSKFTWNYSANYKDAPALFSISKDTAAMTTGQGFAINQMYKCKDGTCVATNNANCNVTYKPEYYKVGPTWVDIMSAPKELRQAVKNKTVKIAVKTKKSGTGAYVDIPMAKNYKYKVKIKTKKGKYKTKTYTVTQFAEKGTMTVKWWKAGKQNGISLSGNYGHSKLGMKPKLSLSGADIEFGSSTSYGREALTTIPKVKVRR